MAAVPVDDNETLMLSPSSMMDLRRHRAASINEILAKETDWWEYLHPLSSAEVITVCAGLVSYLAMLSVTLLLDNSEDEDGNVIVLPNFQDAMVPLYLGLLQALAFGWLYGVVVWIWERAGIPFIACFRVPVALGGQPMGKFPFLTSFTGKRPPPFTASSGPTVPQSNYTSSSSSVPSSSDCSDDEATAGSGGITEPLLGGQRGNSRSPVVVSRNRSARQAAAAAILLSGDYGEGAHNSRRVLFLAAQLSLLLAVTWVGYVWFVHFSELPAARHLWPGSMFGLAALVIALGFVVLPLPKRCVPYSWTRLSLGAILGQVLTAPVFGVEFVHIVVADAWTSASLTLWSIEESVCFYASGAFLQTNTHSANWCSAETGWHRRIMQPVMYGLPFWIRFLQCWYKFWKTRHLGCRSWAHMHHLVNAGKYFSAICVVVSSSVHAELHPNNLEDWNLSRWLWFSCLVVKTVYCYVWDMGGAATAGPSNRALARGTS